MLATFCRPSLFRGVPERDDEITARERAEQALRVGNENFQLLAENISDAFWIRSADMRELHYVSAGFERIWGRAVSTLYTSPGKWVDFLAPEDRARVVAAFAAFTAGAEALDIEYRILRPDGEVRWVRVRGFKARDAAGQPIRCLGIVTDITEKRHSEQMLRESEERMRLRTTALDAAANGVMITDRRGTIEWVNAAFTRLTGYSAAEVVGRNPRLLKSGQHSASAYREMWGTISAGQVWSGEIINRRKDGQIYHEEMTITPVFDAGAKITHFIAVKQDISERKHAEASIQDLHRKLVAASREAGMADVAIDVLHNTRNVLNSVTVAATLISERVRESKGRNVARLAELLGQHTSDLAGFLTEDATGRKVPAFLASLAEALAAERAAVLSELDTLRQNIDRISAIVARQESVARTVLATELFSVADAVEDALRLSADALSRQDIELVRDYRANPVITSDRQKVTEILSNVLRNARQACNESDRADKRIVVRIESAGERVRIVVSDNGVGIGAENLDRIFSQDLALRKPGHGAGLHRGATTARVLGGSLAATSDGPGAGATFVVELPGQPASPAG